jgi:predicted Rdx family selenoprotein
MRAGDFLRAAWMTQEPLTTFEAGIGEVAPTAA